MTGAWSTSNTSTRSPELRAYLAGTLFTAEQIRFINLIVTELTAVAIHRPRLNWAPTNVFPESDVDNIVAVRNNVALKGGAA